MLHPRGFGGSKLPGKKGVLFFSGFAKEGVQMNIVDETHKEIAF